MSADPSLVVCASVQPLLSGFVGEELADFLAGRGIESWDAIATNPRREWVDRALVVDYADASRSTPTPQL